MKSYSNHMNNSFFHILYSRRSIRNFKPDSIDSELIVQLLDAATQAPSAMHAQPCAFVIIQDPALLKTISSDVKNNIRGQCKKLNEVSNHTLEIINQMNYEVFYNAPALILICSQFFSKFSAADCWLAAENLMLCAQAKGLGSCIIGLSIETFNLDKWKTLLDIPDNVEVIVPIIIGKPDENPLTPQRRPVKIISWKTQTLID
ncbi:nitroreductase family protein [Polynucleobacter kasalickyi]|uniref:Nitroreductase n=1 Tax=Polynucleobacter kasalickyi TaxID=1938817 RepID=A0A1W1Y3T2_9BURK|nr:nitroreductase [Polynucleobacter kasalickyi]SMC30816.1 Nitroreductase [Polynucleobacter kasalickyi]